MTRLNLSLQGGFGNQLSQFAFARAYAERHGMDLCCSPWAGSEIFALDTLPAVTGLPRVTETELLNGYVPTGDIDIRGYFQQQSALIYTRTQAREWFKLRRDIDHRLKSLPSIGNRVCHLRRGDYSGYGYVVVSLESYLDAATQHDIASTTLYFIGEDGAKNRPNAGFDGALEFLPDFYRMMSAKILFRANSTFSWWASVLGDARTLAPVIEGLGGGKEHDCKFVEGNWPRFANLDFVTDLHLQP